MSADNPNPLVFSSSELAAQAEERRRVAEVAGTAAPPVSADDEDLLDEIYGFLRFIRDPEHPRTLEELGVLHADSIRIEHLPGRRLSIAVTFCPTVPHCSLATIIGLSIRVKLLRYFKHAKVNVRIEPGKHMTENESAFSLPANVSQIVPAILINIFTLYSL